MRLGIRRLCAERLRTERRGGVALEAARYAERLSALRDSPVAIHTEAANAQHYELPSAFFELCLGPRMKYSCCLFQRGTETLAEAEEAMLELYAQRAELAAGQQVLERGWGWGPLPLWRAERFPRSRITAVSNSHGQRHHIESQCRARGIENVQVLTRDVNSLILDAAGFDRCVSVEMFEHVRNYDALMKRIASWLKPGGKLFTHIFAHRTVMYPFETTGSGHWMGRDFFTRGLMPPPDTPPPLQDELLLEQRWLLEGPHYRRTADLWLAHQDAQRAEVLAVLHRAYGANARLWFERWRIFWMACSELFGYANGTEWLIAHYRFTRPLAGEHA